MRVRLSRRAERDLEEIRDYLLPRSPQGAERVRQAIEMTINLLGAFPGVGRETDIADVCVLPVVHFPFLVYHTVTPDEVIILHIRHGARAAPSPDQL